MQYTPDLEIVPLESSLPIILGVDPSKTQMAVTIGDISGNIIRVVEVSGTGQETTDYCLDFREFFNKFLQRVKIVFVAFENAIKKKGQEFFKSQLALTEVRAQVINLGVELMKKREDVEPVNNWSWKSAILPPEYRKKDIEKGSVLYIPTLNPKYFGFSDDATDSICIYYYGLKLYMNKYPIFCTQEETPLCKVEIAIIPESEIPENSKEFTVNPHFSLKTNAVFYANRSQKIGICRMPYSLIEYKDIYRYSRSFSNPLEKPVLLVRRGI